MALRITSALALALAAVVGAWAGEVYEGRVLTPDGKPAAGAEVGLYYQHDASGYGSKWVARTNADAEGRFRVEAGELERPWVFLGTPRQALYLTAKARGCVMAEREVFAGQTWRHVMTLSSGRTVKLGLVDGKGKALAGVRVSARRIASPEGGAAFLAPPQMAKGRSALGPRTVTLRPAAAGAPAAPEWEGLKADGEGQVVLDGAPAGLFGLSVQAPGVAEGVVMVKADASEAVVSMGQTAFAREGRVTGPDGAPAPGMVVYQLGQGVWAVTDEQGRYALTQYGRGGGAAVFAMAMALTVVDPRQEPAWAVGSVAGVRPSPGAGAAGAGPAPAAAAGGGDARLGESRLLTGRVTDRATGRAVAGATVAMTFGRTGQAVTEGTLSIALDGDGPTVSMCRLADAEGRYALRLAAVDAVVWADAPRGWRLAPAAPRGGGRVKLTGEETRFDLAEELEREAGAVLCVRGADGKPAAGVEAVAGGRVITMARYVESDPAGRVWAAGLNAGAPTAVYARRPDRSEAALVVVTPEQAAAGQDVEVALRPARAATVEFVGDDGAPLSNPTYGYVLVVAGGAPASVLLLGHKNAPAELRVEGLLPGVEYEVSGMARGEGWSAALQQTRWSFGAGDADVKMILKGGKAGRGPGRFERRAPAREGEQ